MIGVYVRIDETQLPMERKERLFIVVPVPPPTNVRLAGTVRSSRSGKRYAGFRCSEKAKSYQRTIRLICANRKIVPITGDVAMSVRWYRNAKRGDVPDRWKDLCDALQSRQRDPKTKLIFDTGSGPFFDDAQIAQWQVKRDDSDPKNPRCEVEIWSL